MKTGHTKKDRRTAKLRAARKPRALNWLTDYLVDASGDYYGTDDDSPPTTGEMSMTYSIISPVSARREPPTPKLRGPATRTCVWQQGEKWARLTVKVSEEAHQLTISVQEGVIVTEAAARAQALAYWRGYFASEPGAIAEMNSRCGCRCRTPLGAARYVVANDGPFHGLDVDSHTAGEVWLVEGGRRDRLGEIFPEYAHLLPFHLPDMHAECVHQAALGLTWTNAPSAVCETCGWRLGSAWAKHPVPDHIWDLAYAVGDVTSL